MASTCYYKPKAMRKKGASADAAVAPTSEKQVAIACNSTFSAAVKLRDRSHARICSSRGSALHETMYGLATLRFPSFASLPQGTRFSELEGLRVSRRRAGALLPEPALAEPPGTSRTSNPEPEIGQNQNTVFADDTNEESGDSVWWTLRLSLKGPVDLRSRPSQMSSTFNRPSD